MGDEGPGGVDPDGITFGGVAGDGPAGATGAIGGPDTGCDAPNGAAAGAAGAAGRAATGRGSTRSPFDPQAASTSVSSTGVQAKAMRVNIRRHMQR